MRAPDTTGFPSDAIPSVPRDAIVGLLCAYVGETLRFTEAWASAHGMSHTDVRAMAQLDSAHRSGVQLTAGQLGGALGLSSPATSALIRRLESAGHVTRSRDPEDRRRVLLSVSPAAQRSAIAYFQPMGDSVTAALRECDVTEVRAVTHFLERLVNQMRTARVT